MSPLCKLLWLRDNKKGVFRNAAKFVSMKEFVFHRFFGEYVIDFSVASATGLFDIFDLEWNRLALRHVGISVEKLSLPVPPTRVFRGIRKTYAQRMGVHPDIPFVIGASDGCLANLGSNAIVPKSAAVTIGTSGAIRVISAIPRTDPRQRIFSYTLTPDHYALGGSINNGGIALTWFLENFGKEEIQETRRTKRDPYLLLMSKAAKIPVGAEGLLFLPYLLGERAPYWDASLRGVFFGISLRHSRNHFFRAILEGVIFGLYTVGRVLEPLTGPIERIYASGSIVHSDLWLQILSDVFNKKVIVTDSHEAPAWELLLSA